MGKTGLILRLFDELESTQENMNTVYVDIVASRSIDGFIKLMAEAVLKAFKPKTMIGKRVMTFIKSLRPVFLFDTLTGEPQIQIAYQSNQEKEYTLKGLFDVLDSQNLPIVVAIDEFQQIREYPEQNMEALLRSYIQHTHNLTFIFCGSKKTSDGRYFCQRKKTVLFKYGFFELGENLCGKLCCIYPYPV